MTTIELSNIYTILNEAVRYFPINDISIRPNTFAVIEDMKDLTSESLGKSIMDHNKPHFYSRKWDTSQLNPSALSWDFPAVMVLENDSSLDKIFIKNCPEINREFEMYCLIPEWNSCDNCPKAEVGYKTISELYTDAEKMMIYLLSYLKNCIVASASGSQERLYNKAWLEAKSVAYTKNDADTATWSAQFNTQNAESKPLKKAFLPSVNCVAVSITISVTSMIPTEINWHFYPSLGITPDK